MLDITIIGGTVAGLIAAVQLGRSSRSVVMIDDGLLRNRTSPAETFARGGPMQQMGISGVFAAGNRATPMCSVNFAVGDGVRADAGFHQSRLFAKFVPPLEKVGP